jgi:NADPH-dependent glutamate synthase beta subunit-like oxidoreductase
MVCRRGEVTEAIAIRELKRFAVENDQDRLWERNARGEPSTGKRVAIIGSGPAGLTAAYYLAKQGHDVTVFEALPVTGGMMRVGILEYRLPRDVLEMEIQEIVGAGVEIRTNTRVTSLDAFFEEGYNAILVAVGAHVGQKLPIPGADLDGVLIGLNFLRDVNLGKEVKVGGKVVVLGGGNVAFDCARLVRRLGADEVRIVCLEDKTEMSAACDEIKQGEEEGILVYPSRTCTRVLSENGRITGVECLDVASFAFDEDGKANIDPVEGSEQVLPADAVIFAIGQLPEISDQFALALDGSGHISVDTYSFDTSRAGVFAAGDAVMGTSSVIEAIASGRKGAVAVDQYLGGNGILDEELAPREEPETWLGPGDDFAALTRCKQYCIGAAERIKSFCTIVQPLEEEAAHEESSRCLGCDLRFKIAPIRFWGDY